MQSLTARRNTREGCKRSAGARSLPACALQGVLAKPVRPGGALGAPYGYALPACLPVLPEGGSSLMEGAPAGGAPFRVESCQPVPRRGAAHLPVPLRVRPREVPEGGSAPVLPFRVHGVFTRCPGSALQGARGMGWTGYERQARKRYGPVKGAPARKAAIDRRAG